MSEIDKIQASPSKEGHLHPITQVIWEVGEVFRGMGFQIVEGPEVEDEFHNFDALNIPADHPGRDMQDTFWLKDWPDKLPRTQTSAVQIRFMEEMKRRGINPPWRVVVPGGKVFRHEATDARHEAQFYQTECLVVGENITLAHLKGYLETFFKKFYGPEVVLRVRPSFFPFVEPALEVDLGCVNCAGTGRLAGKNCPVCGGTGWLEVAGSGLVHPEVFRSVGIDADKWSGFAFAFGVDRLAMIKHHLDDIRLLYNGDLRFIDQF